MTLALGPINKSDEEYWLALSEPASTLENVQFEIKDVFSFLGGFLMKLTGDSHLPDFSQCEVDGAIIGKEVQWILGYVHKKEYPMVVKLIIAFIKDLPDTLISPCKAGISDEFDLLEHWIEGLFHDVGKLVEKVAKNLLLHTEALT